MAFNFPTQTILLFLYIFLLYTSISMKVLGATIIGLPASILGFVLLLMHIQGLRKREVRFLVGLVFIALVSIVLSPDPRGFFGEYIRSLAQFSLSILSMYGVMLTISDYRGSTISKVSLWLTVGLLIACILEITTPLRDVSNAARTFLLGEGSIYENESREMNVFGRLRPMFLTRETSHVAKFYLIALICYVATSASVYRYLISAALFMVGLGVIGSPTLVVFPIILLAFAMSDSMFSNRFRVVVAVLFIVFLPSVYSIGKVTLGERFRQASTGQDFSTFLRLEGPRELTMEVLSRYPLFGAGIGGKQAISEEFFEVYLRAPHPNIRHLLINEYERFWSNAFAEYWIFLGLLGGGLGLILLTRFAKSFGCEVIFSLALFVIVFNMDAAVVAFRVWAYFGIAVAAIAIGRAELAQLQEGSSQESLNEEFENESEPVLVPISIHNLAQPGT